MFWGVCMRDAACATCKVHACSRNESPTLGIPGACYRNEKAQIPKVPGRVLGRVPGKGAAGGTAGSTAGRPVSLEKQRNGTALLPAAVPFFLALFPALSPALWGFGLSHSCSRRLGFQG